MINGTIRDAQAQFNSLMNDIASSGVNGKGMSINMSLSGNHCVEGDAIHEALACVHGG